MEAKEERRPLPSNEAEEPEYSEGVQEGMEQTNYLEEPATAEQPREQKRPNLESGDNTESEGGFVNGLSVGLGTGVVATFIIMWITLFFTPQIPSSITYETLLSIFIYPLVYLLAVGLIALTAGIVREYYVRRY